MTANDDKGRTTPRIETAAGIMFNWEQFSDQLAGPPRIETTRQEGDRGMRPAGKVVRESDDRREREAGAGDRKP